MHLTTRYSQESIIAHCKHASQKGFTLIELMMVLSILTILAMAQIPITAQMADDLAADAIIEQYQRIQKASIRWRRDHGAWPLNIDTLTSNNYLSADDQTNPWGDIFSITISGDDLVLASDLHEEKYIIRVSGRLPRTSLSGTVLLSSIDPPGEEAAHDFLYSRNGSKALTGNMDAGGNDITNTGNITASRYVDADDNNYYVDPAATTVLNQANIKNLKLVANVTTGTGCITKSIGTNSSGQILACENGQWTSPGNKLPINSIYMSTSSLNPSTSLGYGTWSNVGSSFGLYYWQRVS